MHAAQISRAYDPRRTIVCAASASEARSARESVAPARSPPPSFPSPVGSSSSTRSSSAFGLAGAQRNAVRVADLEPHLLPRRLGGVQELAQETEVAELVGEAGVEHDDAEPIARRRVALLRLERDLDVLAIEIHAEHDGLPVRDDGGGERASLVGAHAGHLLLELLGLLSEALLAEREEVRLDAVGHVAVGAARDDLDGE